MDFNIIDFGAKVCDKPQTQQIQNAIDACFNAGSGKVIIPCGVFLTGGIRLRSNVTLYLEAGAILKGSKDHNDYNGYRDDKIEPIDFPAPSIFEGKPRSVNPYSKWNNGLIKIIDAKNVSIIGEKGSYIDGVDCYDPDGEEHYRGPHAINVYNCEDLHFEGYTVMNSGNWSHNIMNSRNITCKKVTVLGGHDGFDVRTCDDILVEDCVFRTGDDCVAGFDNKNVIVRNCILEGSCSALRFGGTDVLVENCQSIAPPSFGFRGSLSDQEKVMSAPTHERTRHITHTPMQYYCDFRTDIRHIPSMVVKNCKFENPNAIFLHPFDGEHVWCCNKGLASFTYENCEILGVSLPGILCADEKTPLEFRMRNVTITSREENADFPILEARNCKYIEFDNVKVKGFKKPYIITDNKENVKILNSDQIKVKLRK